MNFLKAILVTCINPNNWSIDNILTVISLIPVIIGGIFACRQWSNANKTKRAEYINQIIEKLRFDESLAEAMYIIDYNDTWYDEDFHESNNELEYKIDKLLSYLSYICYLKKEKNIRDEEFKILKYEIERVCTSSSVQSYLWNLYHFSKTQNTECSFQYLIDYGRDNNLISRNIFDDLDSKEYIKNLNF